MNFDMLFVFNGRDGNRKTVKGIVAHVAGEDVFTTARAALGVADVARMIRATATPTMAPVPVPVPAGPTLAVDNTKGGKSPAKLASMAAYNERRKRARALAKASATAKAA